MRRCCFLLSVLAMTLWTLRPIAACDDDSKPLPEPIAKFEGHVGNAYGLAFSPDGKRLTAASGIPRKSAGFVTTWNIQTGKMESSDQWHRNPANGVAYSADGKYIVTTGLAEFLRGSELLMRPIGEVSIDDRLEVLEVFSFWDLAFTPDSRLLIAAHHEKLMIWDVKTRELKAKFDQMKGSVLAVAIASNGSECVCVDSSGNVIRIDLKELKILQQFAVANYTTGATYAAEDRKLIILNADVNREKKELVKAGVTIRNLKTGESSFIETPLLPQKLLLLNEDNLLVCSQAIDAKPADPASIYHINLPSQKIVGIYNCQSRILSIKASSDGKKLAAGTGSGEVVMWNQQQFLK